MKKYVNESQGIVDKDGIQWYDLCDLVIKYIFDLQSGLNSDPFYNGGDAYISKGDIESYYQYINSKKIPEYIFPKWIGKFKIHLIQNKSSKGTFLSGSATLNNKNQLNFEIELNDSKDNDPDIMCDTLIHEFQHAYSKWIKLSKNIEYKPKVANKKQKLYKQSQNAFHDKKYGGNRMIISSQVFADTIEILDEAFENPLYLERLLLMGFYYSDEDEYRSFIQEFARDIMRIIKNNIEKIQQEIKQSLKFKGDYNKITKIEQFQSNILNNLSITCYNSNYYKRYKTFYNFYDKLSKINIDEDVAHEVIKNASKAIKTYLNVPIYKKLDLYEGDASKILKDIANKQLPIYDNVIKKMHKIFIKLLSEVVKIM